MIRASKVTTGVAALIIGLGLAATWALPALPPVPPAPRDAGSDPVTPGRRRRDGRA
jgi:hypothetical protein